jgi:DNA-directed RNA polymerase subunit beta
MNVGQIFECMLGLSAQHLHEHYKILPFDEIQKNSETSKLVAYSKLNESKRKTKKNWLFNVNYPGKTKLIDGRSGKFFHQPVLIGYAYVLKLMHMVDDKLNARLTGPYTLVMSQPVRGKSRNGGQRLGEMEVWAIEGYGAAYTLQEMLTLKSDDTKNRTKLLYNLMNNKNLPEPSVTESLKTLIIEIQCLCMDLNITSLRKHYFFEK